MQRKCDLLLLTWMDMFLFERKERKEFFDNYSGHKKKKRKKETVQIRETIKKGERETKKETIGRRERKKHLNNK